MIVVRFCRFHGESRPALREPPRQLTCCAELLIPHLLRVFLRALRISTISGNNRSFSLIFLREFHLNDSSR